MDSKLIDAALSGTNRRQFENAPDQYYRNATEDYKAKVFHVAGNILKIRGQSLVDGKPCGDEQEKEYIVRRTGVVNIKTGEQRGDDWQHLYFQDALPTIPLGTKFWFDNNVWIAFNTDTLSKVVSNCIVHRCSLLIRLKDEDGNVIREPCFMTNYKTLQNRIYQAEGTNIVNPEDTVIAQFNYVTKKIRVNDRILFGENEFAQAWRVKSVLPFIRSRTYDDDSRSIISFVMERTHIKATDDIVNGIADNSSYDSVFLPDSKPEQPSEGAQLLINISDGDFSIEQYQTKRVTVNAVVDESGAEAATAAVENVRFSFDGAPEAYYSIGLCEEENAIDIRCDAPCNIPLIVTCKCIVNLTGGFKQELSGTCTVLLDGNI